MKKWFILAALFLSSILSFSGGLYSGIHIDLVGRPQVLSAIWETILNATNRILLLEKLNAGDVEDVKNGLMLQLDGDILTLRMYVDEGAKMEKETSEAIRVILERASRVSRR